MKLSEISTDQGMDIIAVAVPALGRMLETDAAKSFLTKYGNRKLTQALMIKAMLELIPELIKTSKNDVLLIISVFTGKPLAAIKKQPFMESYNELKDIVSDPEFLRLFKSSVNTEPGASSVSSQEPQEQSDVTE